MPTTIRFPVSDCPAQIRAALDCGFTVMNGKSGLVGSHLFPSYFGGPWRNGRQYVALDPQDATYELAVKANLKAGACMVELEHESLPGFERAPVENKGGLL